MNTIKRKITLRNEQSFQFKLTVQMGKCQTCFFFVIDVCDEEAHDRIEGGPVPLGDLHQDRLGNVIARLRPVNRFN